MIDLTKIRNNMFCALLIEKAFNGNFHLFTKNATFIKEKIRCPHKFEEKK